MKKWSFENFKKGPLMTMLGVALMVASVLVYLKVPNSEVFALALLGLGAVCFGLKDPRIPPAGGLIPLLVLGVALSSCVTWNKCVSKFGTGETHTITVRDTINDIDTVYVSADSLKGSVSIDDLLSGKIDSLVHTSSSQNLQIKLWYDKYSNLLRYRADLKPDTIVKQEKIFIEVEADCPDAVVVDPTKGLGWREKLWLKFQFFSAFLVLIELVLLVVYMIIQRNKKPVNHV